MADVRSEHAPDSPAPDAPAGPSGHPLFPRAENETGPDLRRIDLIHIERIKEDGTWEACPRVFKAHELQSWKDVVDMFGGGVYRARAQCKKTYQWQGMTERKEFNGPPSRPFCEEAPRPKPAASPAPSAEAASPPPPPATASFPHASHPWTPPPGWTPPAGWVPPSGWTGMLPPAASPTEPPAWIALLLKALDRPQAPTNDPSLFAVMFKAQAEQNAVMLKAQADRDAMLLKLLVDRPTTAPAAANPLEMIREIAPLLKNNTAPGQFLQGVEVAKSLLQQAAPAPAQEDFASTLANIMRTLNPQALTGFPGVSSTPSAPAAPAPAPAPPAAPVLNLDDVIRMAARDRNLAQRFIEEMRRYAQPANDTASSTRAAPAPTPAASAPAPASAPAVPAPAAPAHTAASTVPASPAPAPATAPTGPEAASPAQAPSAISSPAAAPTTTSTPTSSTAAAPSAALRTGDSTAAAPSAASPISRSIAPAFLDLPSAGPASLPPPGSDMLGSALAADQDEPDDLAFPLEALLGAIGDEGRRALLLSLTGQSLPGAATAGKGPPTA